MRDPFKKSLPHPRLEKNRTAASGQNDNVTPVTSGFAIY
jgi:hypothetical protein